MTWDDFLVHVLPSVPECPDPLAVDHLRKAARAFARRTLVWNYSANPIDSKASVSDYTLQIATDEELVRILACSVDGRDYRVPYGVTGRRMARENTGNVCVMLGAFDFRLAPAPHMDALPIVTDVAVMPSLTSNRWPDDFAQYTEVIASGALASLFALPRKAWTDLDMAAVEKTKFDTRAATEAIKVMRGLGTDQQGHTVRFF